MNKLSRYSVLLTASALAGAPLIAAAWSHGKPGLWAMTTQMNFTKGGPQIPPDQAEKMKQMGIKLPFGEPITTNICITPEQAARDTPLQPPQREKGCQVQNLKVEGSSGSGDLVCTGETKGTGHFQSSYQNDESSTGSMTFAGTTRNGEFAMNSQTSGKWLSADCGSVKPAGK